jgi:DNA repair protein RadA/Sms
MAFLGALALGIMAFLKPCFAASYGNPRRLAVGFDQNRLAMLLAILTRHGGIFTASDEIYANVVGGIKVTETSAEAIFIRAKYSKSSVIGRGKNQLGIDYMA